AGPSAIAPRGHPNIRRFAWTPSGVDRTMPLVKIKNFPSRMFAEMARQTLEQEGVLSWIRSPDLGILGTARDPVPQGADLYVGEEDAMQARELILALFGDV